ncbi:MAG: PEP-CTERM sorting domain-containing protein [Candidatus Didemnitutus sp.]|nr:PEP-CTERM sorting domain-containing protein [Candidatus Didemnitutus sp.]
MNTTHPTHAGGIWFARLLPSFAVALVASFALSASIASAQTLLTNPADVTWFKSRTGDSITPGATNVLFVEGQTSGSSFIMNFPTANVAVGETLTVSLSFTTGGTVNNTTSNSFRFGVFNNGGTPITANFNSNSPGASEFTNDFGYMFQHNFNGASSLGMYARDAGTGTMPNTLLSTTASPGWLNIASDTTGTPAPVAASTFYTLTLSLARIDGGYTFSSLLNGGATSEYARTVTDTTSGSIGLASFNSFAFYINGGSNAMSAIDLSAMNISVAATVIPEPSTYAALVGLCALGLVAYRRRFAARA